MSVSSDLDALWVLANAKMAELLADANAGVRFTEDGESIEILLDQQMGVLERLRKLRTSVPGRAEIRVKRTIR